MSESDDEQPQLSSSTLAALQEFLKEKYEQQILMEHVSKEDQVSNILFDENWQLSQFWYDDKTIEAFVRGALNSTPADGKIALISCPTLYSKLKRECSKRQITLFEYDSRFKTFGADFIQYDYKSPLNVPKHMSSQFDLVIADPPFLSVECLTKTAITIKFLMKKNIVLCTGAVMTELAEKLLDVKKCDFIPSHRNNLANEFCCFSNFDFDKTRLHSKTYSPRNILPGDRSETFLSVSDSFHQAGHRVKFSSHRKFFTVLEPSPSQQILINVLLFCTIYTYVKMRNTIHLNLLMST